MYDYTPHITIEPLEFRKEITFPRDLDFPALGEAFAEKCDATFEENHPVKKSKDYQRRDYTDWALHFPWVLQGEEIIGDHLIDRPNYSKRVHACASAAVLKWKNVRHLPNGRDAAVRDAQLFYSNVILYAKHAFPNRCPVWWPEKWKWEEIVDKFIENFDEEKAHGENFKWYCQETKMDDRRRQLNALAPIEIKQHAKTIIKLLTAGFHLERKEIWAQWRQLQHMNWARSSGRIFCKRRDEFFGGHYWWKRSEDKVKELWHVLSPPKWGQTKNGKSFGQGICTQYGYSPRVRAILSIYLNRMGHLPAEWERTCLEWEEEYGSDPWELENTDIGKLFLPRTQILIAPVQETEEPQRLDPDLKTRAEKSRTSDSRLCFSSLETEEPEGSQDPEQYLVNVKEEYRSAMDGREDPTGRVRYRARAPSSGFDRLEGAFARAKAKCESDFGTGYGISARPHREEPESEPVSSHWADLMKLKRQRNRRESF